MADNIASLYADDPRQYAANMRGYLEQQGMPVTAENLNRISLAVSQAMRGGQTEAPSLDAAIERTMAPPAAQRTATTPTAQRRDDVRVNAGADAADATTANIREGAMSGVTLPPRQSQDSSAQQTRGERVAAENADAATAAGVDQRGSGGASAWAAQDGGIARGGTIPRQRYVDENDPLAGMFDPAAVGGRQADETGVNQAALAATLGAGLLGGPLAASLLARGAGVPATVQNPYASITGIRPNAPPPAAAQLSAPQPQLPGSGGAALRLPAPNTSSVINPRTANPARVTVQGRSGQAVREPYNPGGDSAGRTALSRRMMRNRGEQ